MLLLSWILLAISCTPFPLLNQHHNIKLFGAIELQHWSYEKLAIYYPFAEVMNKSKGVSSPMKKHCSPNLRWAGQCLFPGSLTYWRLHSSTYGDWNCVSLVLTAPTVHESAWNHPEAKTLKHFQKISRLGSVAERSVMSMKWVLTYVCHWQWMNFFC